MSGSLFRAPEPPGLAQQLDVALAHLQAGETEAALQMLRAIRVANPLHGGAARALADGLHQAGRLPEAASAYQVALRLDAAQPEGWFGLGCAQLAQNAYGAAIVSLTEALRQGEWNGPAHFNLAKALFETGRVSQAAVHFERASMIDRKLWHEAWKNIVSFIPGDADFDHQNLRDYREMVAKEAARGLRQIARRRRRRAPGEKLRIGYVSAFFGAQNWMKPVYAVINRHSRADFAIHLICDGMPPAAAAGYADHEADTVHDITGVGNARAAAIVAKLDLDLLIDLNGYSASERLGFIMHKPAPVIVGWFNHFATSGIAAYDWLIGDEDVIRPEEERFYTERIHRVPGSYLAFEVLYRVPDVAPAPYAEKGFVTFGCLGSQYKITDAVLEAWAAILREVPDARLFVKNGTLADASTRDDLCCRLKALGIAAERITLEGRSAHFAFLEAYAKIDVALDTFPYNGGTTTTEALWQGVPVLTFDGDRWASRTSASLLRAAGLAEWVLPDRDRFIAQGIAVGRDPGALPALRAGMRERVRASAACDAEGLCRHLENFYTRVA